VPGWLGALIAGIAVAAAIAFAIHQRNARHPVIPHELLRSGRITLGLAGALLGYLVLFGPLVLVPQLLAGHGGVVRTGLILSALPAGFGVAALSAEAVLPRGRRNRTRGSIGAAACAAVMVMLASMSSSTVGIILLIGLAGLCLGVLVPANNALIMRTGAASSAGSLGGLVNMARGIGTTLGIALMTLALHVAGPAGPGRQLDGTLAFTMLAAAAACAAVIALTIRPLPGAPGEQAPGDPAQLEATGAFS
jgi:Major Facilitator Superfamily